MIPRFTGDFSTIRENNIVDVFDKKKNKWREARIIEVGDGYLKIHYKGYANKFDEIIESSEFADRVISFNQGLSKN
jgi:hypothetical protein